MQVLLVKTMETNNFIISTDKKSIRTELWNLIYCVILGRYKYEGIDGEEFDIEIDSIERALMYSGMCAIFRNANGKIVALPCVTQTLNQYGRPATVTAYKFAHQTKPSITNPKLEPMTTNLVVGVDCALILNNATRMPSMVMVQPYINRLAKIWKEHGNNITMSRVFAIVGATSDVADTIKKNYEDMLEKGMLVVSGGGNVDMFAKTLQKFDLGVEYRGEQYQKDFDETWAKMLTVLGINNVGTEKRERLLVDEISANNEMLNIIRDTTFAYREKGIKEANKLFGVNISIKRGGEDEREAKMQDSPKNEGSDREVGGNDTQ